MNDRIALFSPTLNSGGAERVMLNLATGFADRGHEVDMVLSSAVGEYLKDLDPRVRLVDLGARRVVTSLPRLIGYFRQAKPKALLATQHHANVIAVLAATLARSKTRVVVREVTSPDRERAERKSISSQTASVLARHLYSRAYRVIAVCDALRDQIVEHRKVSRDHIEVIYNPVRSDLILEQSRAKSGHAWLDTPEERVILAIGRLERVKDFDSLIRAFVRVRKRIPAKLVILGDGSLRGELTDLAKTLSISEYLDMPGFVRNPYAYMARADVVVLSSLWEGLPNVLLEAMILGTPIVSTNCETGPREILRGGQDGMLVPVGNPEVLADGIVECLETRSRGPVDNVSLRRFDFDHVVDQYLRVMLD